MNNDIKEFNFASVFWVNGEGKENEFDKVNGKLLSPKKSALRRLPGERMQEDGKIRMEVEWRRENWRKKTLSKI